MWPGTNRLGIVLMDVRQILRDRGAGIAQG